MLIKRRYPYCAYHHACPEYCSSNPQAISRAQSVSLNRFLPQNGSRDFHFSLISIHWVSYRMDGTRVSQRVPFTQLEHRTCGLFGWPQDGHVLKFLISFNALPAICRCRRFMCEVFFLGTARRMDSQMSVRNDGKLLVRETLRTESAVEGDHCWLMGFGRRIAGRMGSSDSDGRAKPRVNCNAMVDGDSCSRRRQNGGGCT